MGSVFFFNDPFLLIRGSATLVVDALLFQLPRLSPSPFLRKVRLGAVALASSRLVDFFVDDDLVDDLDDVFVVVDFVDFVEATPAFAIFAFNEPLRIGVLIGVFFTGGCKLMVSDDTDEVESVTEIGASESMEEAGVPALDEGRELEGVPDLEPTVYAPFFLILVFFGVFWPGARVRGVLLGDFPLLGGAGELSRDLDFLVFLALEAAVGRVKRLMPANTLRAFFVRAFLGSTLNRAGVVGAIFLDSSQ